MKNYSKDLIHYVFIIVKSISDHRIFRVQILYFCTIPALGIPHAILHIGVPDFRL